MCVCVSVPVCVVICGCNVRWHLAHVSHLRAEELTETDPLESITAVTHRGFWHTSQLTLIVWKTGTHTHTHQHTHAFTFRMKVSSVRLSMTSSTCDGRVLLIATYEQTNTTLGCEAVLSCSGFFKEGSRQDKCRFLNYSRSLILTYHIQMASLCVA